MEVVGDESDFLRISQIMRTKDSTIQCGQIGQARVPKSCAPFVRAFPSCQNPVNFHMGHFFFFFGEAPMNSNWNSCMLAPVPGTHCWHPSWHPLLTSQFWNYGQVQKLYFELKLRGFRGVWEDRMDHTSFRPSKFHHY